MIQELVESCGGLSRMELARTVCELLDWKRPTGKLKARECREFLERLEGEGRLELPDKRPGKPVGTRTRIPQTERGEPSEPLEGVCLLFIHPGAPNLISLRSAGTMPA